MNKRLKELAEQAGGVMFGELCGTLNFDVERFAELVRADEREACAVACESLALSDDYYTHFYVEAIRSRGVK
jgi:hypothetical protein